MKEDIQWYRALIESCAYQFIQQMVVIIDPALVT